MSEFKKVLVKADVPEGTGKEVKIGDRELAVFNSGGTFHAIDNTCLHRGGPLAEGTLEGCMVVCPWHAWQFDITTGVCATTPDAKLRRYDVKVEGDDILVAV